MSLTADYLGMPLEIDALDAENLAYFKLCADHDYHLQRCGDCGLIRYPPGTACPWCASAALDWVPVDARGAVHSYTEVHHAIQVAFKAHAPYQVLIVDLDTQKGEPTPDEALRVLANLADVDGNLAPPNMVARVGIGTRVKMVFKDVAPGLAIPLWTIDEDAEQPAKPWRYPQE